MVVGSNVTLSCAADDLGEPEAYYRWKGPEDRDYMYERRNPYTIQNVQLVNAGEYSCLPENEYEGNARRGTAGSYKLKVLEIAQVSSIVPTEREVKAGDQVISVACSARGNPKPTISWLKDGEELTPNGHWSMEQTDVERICPDSLRCSHEVSSLSNRLRRSPSGHFDRTENRCGLVSGDRSTALARYGQMGRQRCVRVSGEQRGRVDGDADHAESETSARTGRASEQNARRRRHRYNGTRSLAWKTSGKTVILENINV